MRLPTKAPSFYTAEQLPAEFVEQYKEIDDTLTNTAFAEGLIWAANQIADGHVDSMQPVEDWLLARGINTLQMVADDLELDKRIPTREAVGYTGITEDPIDTV